MVLNTGLTSDFDTSTSIRNYNSQGSQISANYFEYSPDSLKDVAKDGKTVLFFAAPWCGTCTMLDKELKENSSDLLKDLTVLKVNFDTQHALKKNTT